jgi:hypothetical protein
MGLLGKGWDDPQSAAIMALAGGLLQGNFGGGLLGASNAFNEAGDRRIRRSLLESQIEENKAQVEARKLAAQKQAEGLALMKQLIAPQTSYAPGQLGSGTFGVLPNSEPLAPPRASGGLAGASPEQIAMLKAVYGHDLTEQWKAAKQGFELRPGTFREDASTGKREYIGDPTKGIGYEGGRVTLMPGAVEAQTQLAFANKLPEVLAQSAGRVNLRKNADGTESPVAELSENPLLQGMFGNLFGGGGPARPQAPQASPTRAPAPAGGSRFPMVSPPGQPQFTTPPVSETRAILEGELSKAQSMLAGARTPEEQRRAQNDIASLQRELGRIGGAPAPGIGYGKTTAQETKEAANRASQIKQAEADVTPTSQRKSDISSANYMLSVVDQAISHPGRATATGLSGTLDPRNYIAGTNAKGFQALLDQIRGGTFMQAYQNLKGGGQITEVEGKKAENAIARLSTAQSDKDFLSALQEFRSVLSSGLERMKSGATAAGVSPEFNGDNARSSNVVQQLPKSAAKGTRARDTATGETLVFNGLAWVKER